ncbi:MAG: hypothetical protein LBG17_00140 [Bacteroidales bacterium]|jgi:prophage antirepressor-like protein|nr:hypothetical protein [Bacteroidales bacterium]
MKPKNKKQKQITDFQSIPELFTFDHNHKPIRVEMIDGEPWFVAKDVCDVLGITVTGHTFQNFPDNECGRYNIPTTSSGKSKARETQEMLIVNEPGLYRLIFKSRKPEAEKFKTWVFEVILPVLRKTGKYAPEIIENDCPYTQPDVMSPVNEQLYSQEATEWVLSIMSDVCYAMNNACHIENSVLRTNMATNLMAIRDKLIE